MKTTLSMSMLTLAITLVLSSTANAVSSREADALNKSTVSLMQASQIAEKQEAGKTINVEFDIEKDRPIWEVKVLGNTGVKEYKIDATTGAVVKIEDEHIRGKLINFVTGMNLKDLNSAKTTFAQAVAAAEKKINGKAVKAEVEHERGAIQYDVFVRSGEKTTKVKMEAAIVAAPATAPVTGKTAY